ncbi:gamma carbonic anhydrase family protein [Xanthomonas translucens pv. graminis]|uniref:gamma carbonic anhydrase family protein n=1 Tax=Xanthomonas graminis TaxID=3390026 RepID=UPI002540C46E|nr:gamma carbonic anhydrase family protein [Xanthomonas translucens]WIH05352.1 gamma carbonic anhydrase family protein [Xanthomonas translucens pv. graminis]
MAPIRPFLDKSPQLGAHAYVDPACTIIGDVVLGENVSVWPDPVIRGDVNRVRIGARSNIQDGAILHACTIENLCLIGMGACLLDGATVKKYGFVGAGAVVGSGKTVGERELWLGNPARLARTRSDKEIERLHYCAQHYVRLKDRYLDSSAKCRRRR